MLRRDRGLFALVAVFALALAMLQPAVPSAAAEGFVICSEHDGSQDVQKQAPARHDQCPCCIFGHLCGGMAAPAKALIPAGEAFGLPADAALWRPSRTTENTHAERRTALPPGIRAPPPA